MTMAKGGDFDLQDFLPYLLNQAAETTSRGFQATYRARYGLTRTQWRVMANLGRFGAMTARDICRISHVEKTKVSRAVAGLEAEGLLTRSTSPDDRRAENLALTPKGRAIYHRDRPAGAPVRRRLAQPPWPRSRRPDRRHPARDHRAAIRRSARRRLSAAPRATSLLVGTPLAQDALQRTSRPSAPRRDHPRQPLAVLPGPPDEGRPPAGQPGQAHKVKARHLGHAVLVARATVLLEDVQIDPAEIQLEPRGPDDAGDAFRLQVQRQVGLVTQSGRGSRVRASGSSGRSRPLARA
jgi:DNA-binding MarR family transcriptional regulator